MAIKDGWARNWLFSLCRLRDTILGTVHRRDDACVSSVQYCRRTSYGFLAGNHSKTCDVQSQ